MQVKLIKEQRRAPNIPSVPGSRMATGSTVVLRRGLCEIMGVPSGKSGIAKLNTYLRKRLENKREEWSAAIGELHMEIEAFKARQR